MMLETNTATGVQNPRRPVDIWTQESNEGLILFVVFYSKACQWRRCVGCNFHDNASKEHITYEDLIGQIDYVFDNLDTTGVNKIIISNGGSILDESTFSTTALIYLVAKLNMKHQHIKIISLESRLEYIDIEELTILKRALIEGNDETELEIGVGFEAFDDHIRNVMFDKGLDKKDFMDFLFMVSGFKYSVKCYFMLKPVPGLSDEDAIADISQAISFLSDMSQQFGVKINMHLNPTYVAKGTKLVKPFEDGEYTPPTLVDVAKSIIIGKTLDNENFSIYIGLSDEGLAVEGGSFINNDYDITVASKLEKFNRTQNYDLVEEIIKVDEES